MGLDRWVWWGKAKNSAKLPSREDVANILTDFLRGVGEVEWNSDSERFICNLHGEWSDPAVHVSFPGRRLRPEEGFRMRWIEVCLSDNCLNIITRQQDPVTEAIADGLAKYFALYWKAKLEIG